MKKTILILIPAVILTLSMSSCGGEKKTDDKKTDSTSQKPAETPPKGTISTNSSEYMPGDEIKITFTAEGTFDPNSAKIVIMSSSEPHEVKENNYAAYIRTYYMSTQTNGEITLVAPRDNGNYDVRMINRDSSGTEVTYSSFVVSGEGNTVAELSIDKTSYTKGEVMKVTFKAPVAWETTAWLGIIPSNVKHGEAAEADKYDRGWKFLDGRNGGTLDMYLPDTTGKFDLRMFDANAGKEVKSVPFTIK